MAKVFELEWAFEAFSDDLSFISKNMFGCKAAYLGGKIVLLLAENPKEENWCGILYPSEKDQHEAIMAEYPELRPHKILPKWLYMPMSADSFEETATSISKRIAMGDERFGAIPKPKKKKTGKKKVAKKKAARRR